MVRIRLPSEDVLNEAKIMNRPKYVPDFCATICCLWTSSPTIQDSGYWRRQNMKKCTIGCYDFLGKTIFNHECDSQTTYLWNVKKLGLQNTNILFVYTIRSTITEENLYRCDWPLLIPTWVIYLCSLDIFICIIYFIYDICKYHYL